MQMSMYFTKDDDLILFHFSMKKLNMFNFLHIKMMKISFEITRHLCFVFATSRNLHTFVCFYVQEQSSSGLLSKSVLRNFAKFTGKHLCQSLFFNKTCNFIKKEALAQAFSCEFCEISKNNSNGFF